MIARLKPHTALSSRGWFTKFRSTIMHGSFRLCDGELSADGDDSVIIYNLRLYNRDFRAFAIRIDFDLDGKKAIFAVVSRIDREFRVAVSNNYFRMLDLYAVRPRRAGSVAPVCSMIKDCANFQRRPFLLKLILSGSFSRSARVNRSFFRAGSCASARSNTLP